MGDGGRFVHRLPPFVLLLAAGGLWACDAALPADPKTAPVAAEGPCQSCHVPPEAVLDPAQKVAGIAATHFDDWQHDEEGTLVSVKTRNVEGRLFDAPLEWAPEGVGYVTRASPQACAASCHDGHRADMTLPRAWARSRHANATSEPATHEFTSAACARCHSGVAFATYIDASNTAFPAWTEPKVVPQADPFTCNTCHDAAGLPTAEAPRLRRAGMMPLVSGSGATFTVDATIEAGAAATCIACHQGRESGATLYKLMRSKGADPYDAITQTLTETSFLNPHYAVASALLYGVKGFELPGRAYSPGNVFHQTLGCPGCHMVDGDTTLGGHTFAVRTEEGAENLAACVECHGPIESFDAVGLARDLDGDGVAARSKQELGSLVALLQKALAASGVYYYDAHPYFYTSPEAHDRTTWVRTWSEAQLIAAFNLKLVKADHGAFAHNFRYAAQLLRDAYALLAGREPDGLRPSTLDDRPATAYIAP